MTPPSPPPRSRRVLVADAWALVGLWLFLAGGVHGRFPSRFGELALDFGQFGLGFLPLLALGLLRPEEARRSLLHRPLRALVRWVTALPPAQLRGLMVASLGTVALFQLAGIFARYHAFGAAMDLAIYANACAGGLRSTMKGDVWLFADHFEPALALFTPLCRVAHPSKALLVVQWLAWLVGAAGIYRLARHHRWSRGTAYLLAFLYLQLPGLVAAVRYDFHLLSLAIGALPWLWLWADEARWARFWPLAIFVLGLKECAALSLMAFGIYLALTPGAGRRRGHGILLAALSLALFVVIMKVVYPHYRGGAGTMYFSKYYGHLGNSFGEFLHTALTRPLYFASTFVTARKLFYLFLVLAPFAGLPCLRPLALLPVAFALFINLATNDSNLQRVQFHYEVEIFPLLFAATTGLVMDDRVRAWFARRRLPLSPRAAWLAVLLVFFSGSGLGFYSTMDRPEPMQVYLEQKLRELVPRDESVAANQQIAAHLTDRRRLYMMDYLGMEEDWRRADVIVVAYPSPHLGWFTAEEFERRWIPRFAADFDLVYTDRVYPSFRIWHRRVDASSSLASGGARLTK